jgi:hypothetical protein
VDPVPLPPPAQPAAAQKARRVTHEKEVFGTFLERFTMDSLTENFLEDFDGPLHLLSCANGYPDVSEERRERSPHQDALLPACDAERTHILAKVDHDEVGL